MQSHHLSYEEAALRDNEPYLVVFHYPNGLIHVIPFTTLSEAITRSPMRGSISELVKVEALVEGVPVEVPLAVIVDCVWMIAGTQKELTMAKIKDAGRDVASSLLGVTRPRAKKQAELVAAARPVGRPPGRPPAAVAGVSRGVVAKKTVAATPTPRGSRMLFQDHQRIKVVGQRNTRPDSNVGKVISLLRPNMTFAEFSKAVEKAGLPFKPSGILSFLVKDGVAQVR